MDTLPRAAPLLDVQTTVVVIPAATLTRILPGDPERWTLRIFPAQGPFLGAVTVSPDASLDPSNFLSVPATGLQLKWVEDGPLVQSAWYAWATGNSRIVCYAVRWKG